MPPRLRTIESVTEERNGETDCWRIVTRATDGHGVTHVFPKAVLEWRVAEFGIDPTDVDTLLDTVLHEAFVDDAQDGPPAAVLAARSTAAAWQAHTDRLAAVKATRERIILDRGKTNLLDLIRQRPGIGPAGIHAKRELVDIHRWNRLYGGLPVPMPSSPEEAIHA